MSKLYFNSEHSVESNIKVEEDKIHQEDKPQLNSVQPSADLNGNETEGRPSRSTPKTEATKLDMPVEMQKKEDGLTDSTAATPKMENGVSNSQAENSKKSETKPVTTTNQPKKEKENLGTKVTKTGNVSKPQRTNGKGKTIPVTTPPANG